MRIVRDVAAVRAAVAGAGRVGLVPTMGAFHEGHLSLVRAARATCDLVVVWLFVNPTQFNDASDLVNYPRDEDRDAALAAECGADILFAPTVEEVYPAGFATTVTVSGLADVLEGAHRPGHFAGVATVVAKMLNMVRPDVAFFGAKDAQQVAVVRRMAADLDLGVEIEVLPIVREADGLAMSSRNVRLDPDERRRATALHRGLQAARTAVADGERDPWRALPRGRGGARGRRDHRRVRRGDRPGLVRARGHGRRPHADRARRPGGPRPPDRQPGGGPMIRTMLKSKIHRAKITDSDLHYVGSITVDPDLLDAADIRIHEQVAVVDVDNGARFETYTIAGEPGSGEIKVNGAAARLVHTGDTVILISYGLYTDEELAGYVPKVVHVDRANRILAIDADVASLHDTGRE